MSGHVARAGAAALIVATGALCAWPLLAGGGWFTSMDNPCHLAVLDDLARGEGGWSDAAFLGFPATAVHSPLWYGLLGRLAAGGVPAGLLVALFNFLGFVAPALAVLAVARRRAPLWAAALAAYLVLVQRPWLAGFESPLAGMATFGVAAACLVLLVGELAERDASPARLARIGAWTGLLGITHLFLIAPAALAFLLASLTDLRDAAGRRRALARMGAAALGAAAAAPFWLPALHELGRFAIRDAPLAPHLGLLYLLLPLHPLDLVNGELAWQDELAFTDIVPMAALLVAGLFGARAAWRDPAARLGLLLAGAIAAIVLVAVPLAGAPLLGPHTWRRLMLVRLGLALAAAPALAAVPALASLSRRRATIAGAAVLLAASGLWWQRPLRLDTPARDSAQIAQLAQAWRWLAANRPADRGRLYVQDTFYLTGERNDLMRSHLPALTARETGWEQVGAFYGGMPLATESWTAAQFGLICGGPLLNADDLRRVLRLLPAAGVTRLLLANPALADRLAATGLFVPLYRSGPFTVLDVVGATPNWAQPGPGCEATVTARAPGRWALTAWAGSPAAVLRLSLAWAPGWRVEGSPGVRVRAAPDGRIELTGLPSAPTSLTLVYRPDRTGWALAMAGWVALGGLAAVPRGRRRDGTSRPAR